jgi:hypothetical protein
MKFIKFIVLNHGHVSAVKFITSVEVSKNQNSANQSIQTSDTSGNSSKDQSSVSSNNVVYKTIVITGGQGYEEYKSTNQFSTGVLLGNSGVNNIANTNNQQTSSVSQSDGQNSVNGSLSGSVNTPASASIGGFFASGTASSNIQPNIPYFFSSFSVDESTAGKEDLINYVLTWAI